LPLPTAPLTAPATAAEVTASGRAPKPALPGERHGAKR
jgi:hypothetical protein